MRDWARVCPLRAHASLGGVARSIAIVGMLARVLILGFNK